MRILCIPYSHTFSHLARPLAVALELRRRGHEVHFAGESPKLRHVSEAGFQAHPLFEPDPKALFDRIREGTLRFVTTKELNRMIEADLELAGRLRPDVVLTDGRFSAAISMQLGGHRHAAIVNVSSCEYRALPYVPLFEGVPERLAPQGSLVRRVLNRVNLAVEMTVFDTAMGDFSRLSRRHSLRKRVTATNCLTGADMTLLADIPEYFPTRTLPADTRYVGPLGWELPQGRPDWWPLPRRDGPMIYMTMGTTGIPEFFQRVTDVFEAEGWNAVITTGGQTRDVASPSRFIRIEEFVDGELVIVESDVVVCHGGNGSVYQALRLGKPIVGIPTIPDQKFNMRRVQALGAGLTVTPEAFLRSPASLKQAVERVLEDAAYTSAARRLGQIIQTRDAPRACAEALESLGAGGPPPLRAWQTVK